MKRRTRSLGFGVDPNAFAEAISAATPAELETALKKARNTPASAYVYPFENPALSEESIAIVNGVLARANAQEAFRIGAAFTVCMDAKIAPDEFMLRGAGVQETVWDARALAAEYVQQQVERRDSQ